MIADLQRYISGLRNNGVNLDFGAWGFLLLGLYLHLCRYGNPTDKIDVRFILHISTVNSI